MAAGILPAESKARLEARMLHRWLSPYPLMACLEQMSIEIGIEEEVATKQVVAPAEGCRSCAAKLAEH